MAFLLELKEKLRIFYGKYETYLLPVIKFLLAAVIFWLIRQHIGYMERLNSLSMLLVLALVCSILPVPCMLLAAGIMVALHCYALSMQAGVMVFVLFVIMYLLYFRFAPAYGYNVLLMPVAHILGIPYAVPVANGLLQQPVSVIPTACGTVTYYFLEGIIANASSLSVMGEDETIISKFREIINQFTGNREMYLSIAIFVPMTLLVYFLRRLSMDHAWTVAIITGILTQFLLFFIGYMQLGMSSNKTTELAVGSVVSILVLTVVKFFCFNLDYTRTERVQFEDDEYYYYVKAVPKQYVPTSEKTIKRINENTRGRRAERASVTREELMEDMDIDLNEGLERDE